MGVYKDRRSFDLHVQKSRMKVSAIKYPVIQSIFNVEQRSNQTGSERSKIERASRKRKVLDCGRLQLEFSRVTNVWENLVQHEIVKTEKLYASPSLYPGLVEALKFYQWYGDRGMNCYLRLAKKGKLEVDPDKWREFEIKQAELWNHDTAKVAKYLHIPTILRHIRVLDKYFLNSASKTKKTMYLFRGVQSIDYFRLNAWTTNRSFLSTSYQTSLNPGFFKYYSKHSIEQEEIISQIFKVVKRSKTIDNMVGVKQCCMLCLRIPKGMPFIAMGDQDTENEILLPRNLEWKLVNLGVCEELAYFFVECRLQ